LGISAAFDAEIYGLCSGIDSLIQVIESLTPEESLLFQQKLSARAIQSTPGVCGGYARIRNTRIPVCKMDEI
jgi:Protein of unknown function (DUF433)